MKMKIVIIDNYDSFTYNLAHLVKELDAEVTVFRNDQFQLSELDRFDKIILSPLHLKRPLMKLCLRLFFISRHNL